jgi:ubiquinone/menaquinone biosynthesis C-methylase UbiE
MNYDATAIAATYDAARSYPPDVLRLWLDRVTAHAPPAPQVILDVGCGTGRFTHPLAERFAARVIGIDPSQKMLAAARSKPSRGRVEMMRASAEELPMRDGSADLIFMSMTLHHLADRQRAARECRRVLRAAGRLIVRNATRDCRFPQARFFCGFQAIAEAELPSRDEVFALFEGAGLRLEAYELVSHPLAASWQELADKLALRADSFLARLPDAEFEAGIAHLRAYAARHREDGVIGEHVPLFVFGG